MPSRTTTGRRCAPISKRALPRGSSARHTSAARYPERGTGANQMIESIHIVGARGRVGSTVSARLAERGVALGSASSELVLLCVPDRAIAEVAGEISVGPWVAHVSGATPLDALDPH